MLLGFVEGDVRVDVARLQAEVTGGARVDAGSQVELGVKRHTADVAGDLEAGSANDDRLGVVDGAVGRETTDELGGVVQLFGLTDLGVAVDLQRFIPSGLLGAFGHLGDGGLLESLGALFSGDQSLLDQEVKGGIPLGGGGGECATEGGGGNEELLGAVVHG